jgi:hypothetical protein
LKQLNLKHRKRAQTKNRFLNTRNTVGRKLCKLPEEVTISTLQSSLSLRLWSGDQRERKDYIHNHPVKAGLCRLPEDYKYSSARFYERNEKDWVFLTHHDG